MTPIDKMSIDERSQPIDNRLLREIARWHTVNVDVVHKHDSLATGKHLRKVIFQIANTPMTTVKVKELEHRQEGRRLAGHRRQSSPRHPHRGLLTHLRHDAAWTISSRPVGVIAIRLRPSPVAPDAEGQGQRSHPMAQVQDRW